MPKAKLKISGHPGNYRVHLDDHDISTSLRGLSFAVNEQEWPRVTLDVIVWDLQETELDVIASVPDDTRDLLIRLGWTPPKGESDPEADGFRRFTEQDRARAADILDQQQTEFRGASDG